MRAEQPVMLAIVWHMHQPNYQEPGSSRMLMPWVRLHGLKDYLDMPLAAARRESVRVTFNLVPALLDQLDFYNNGGTDPHLELTQVPADQLTRSQRADIISTFFSAHPPTMIERYPRYLELYRKAQDNFGQSILPELFTSDELRDLQVWSNLVWIDPTFRTQAPIGRLFEKEKYFTEDDKQDLVRWQRGLLAGIVPEYRRLFDAGQIEVSFTPYYHPILPLLCDTESAREATPAIDLPQQRFQHPEDARRQIEMSQRRFEELFGRPMEGMWPSEGSVSDEVAKIAGELGIKWMATDQEILHNSLKKSGQSTDDNPLHAVYEYPNGLRLIFRDHLLSDRIGFVYSGMEAGRAVDDFIHHVHSIRSACAQRLDSTVIPVILDGENAWEYFPNDATEFLDLLYTRLNDDPLIETVTVSQAIARTVPRKLNSLFAGSWISHNFRIWIGHPEDNAAWDRLSETRQALLDFQVQNPAADPTRLAAAWRQIYIAEGSDWCWWYGDEHRGAHNALFDKVFRRQLMAVYELLGLETPVSLLQPIYTTAARRAPRMPEELITPTIDGRLSHFYEWSGAGCMEFASEGGAMHRVERYLSRLFFAYDHDHLYFRLDFHPENRAKLLKKLTCRIAFVGESKLTIEIPPGRSQSAVTSDNVAYCVDEVIELGVRRSALFTRAFGETRVVIKLFDGATEVESLPDGEALRIAIPEKNREMFWPS